MTAEAWIWFKDNPDCSCQYCGLKWNHFIQKHDVPACGANDLNTTC